MHTWYVRVLVDSYFFVFVTGGARACFFNFKKLKRKLDLHDINFHVKVILSITNLLGFFVGDTHLLYIKIDFHIPNFGITWYITHVCFNV